MPSTPRGISDATDKESANADGPALRIAAAVGMLLIDAVVLAIGTFYLGLAQGFGSDLPQRQHHALITLTLVGAVLVLIALVAVANRWTGAAWTQTAVIALAALWAFTVWPKPPPAPTRTRPHQQASSVTVAAPAATTEHRFPRDSIRDGHRVPSRPRPGRPQTSKELRFTLRRALARRSEPGSLPDGG